MGSLCRWRTVAQTRVFKDRSEFFWYRYVPIGLLRCQLVGNGFVFASTVQASSWGWTSVVVFVVDDDVTENTTIYNLQFLPDVRYLVLSVGWMRQLLQFLHFHSACISPIKKLIFGIASLTTWMLLHLCPIECDLFASCASVINRHCNIIILMTGSENTQYHSFSMELTFRLLV